MARAQLRDDRPGRSRSAAPSPAGWAVQLDDEPLLADEPLQWGSGPDADGVVGPALTSSEWALPTVSVLGRALDGYDDDGNPKWEWSPILDGVAATEEPKARTETSDAEGVTLVRTAITVLWPRAAADVPETAMVRDGQGNLWGVVSALRTGDTCRLVVQRSSHG